MGGHHWRHYWGEAAAIEWREPGCCSAPLRTGPLKAQVGGSETDDEAQELTTRLRKAGVAPGSPHGCDGKIPEVQESSPCHSRPLSHE